MADTPTTPVPQTPQILQSLEQATNLGQAAPPTISFNGPQGNLYDSGKARVPAPQVPMRPSEQRGDDNAAPDIHPVDAMASAFIDHLISKDKPQPAPPQADKQPGSFGDKLSGALGALGTGLGDARSGGDPSKGHGWLSAVGSTLSARNERLTREKQQEFENQERLKNDQINIAVANSNLRQHALAIQQAEKSIRDQGAESSSKFIDTMRDNYKVQDKISQDQLSDMVSKDPDYLKTHTGRITGYETVYGADGQPKMADGKAVESPMWSIVDLSPGDMKKQYTVSSAMAKKWADAGLQSVPAGTMMPASVANHMDIQAERYGTSLGLLNLGKVQPLPEDVKDQMASALKDSEVQHALAMAPGSPLAGLYNAQSNISDHLSQANASLQAAQKSGDQKAIQAAQDQVKQLTTTQQNVDKTINSGFTDQERSAYAKQKVDQQKADEKEQHDVARDAEVARHNRAEEQLKAAEAQGSPEAVQGMGQSLADGSMTPTQIPKRAKNYNAYWTAANNSSWGTYGKPFDGAQSEQEFAYSKQKSTQDTLKLINSVVDKNGSLDIAMQQAKALPGLDSQTANKVFNLATSEFGDKTVSNFHTSMLGLADEYSKIMGGGVSSDTGRQQALDILKDAYSKGQLSGAEQILRKDIAARQRGVIGTNRYLQKQYYGTNGMTVTMIAPNGQRAEVPMNQRDAYLGKGARVATPQDGYTK